MPYRKPLATADEGREEKERRSGSCRVLSPAELAVRPVAEIPDLVMRGAQRRTPTSRPSPQDNIMRFWQAGREGYHSGELEHSSTVEPAAEIEVTPPLSSHSRIFRLFT